MVHIFNIPILRFGHEDEWFNKCFNNICIYNNVTLVIVILKIKKPSPGLEKRGEVKYTDLQILDLCCHIWI